MDSFDRIVRIDDAKHPSPPREFSWHFGPRDVRYIAMYLPCGCFNLLPVNAAEITSWEWNRNLSEPTLHPSIRCGEHGWHGFLRGGAFEPV